MTVFKSLRKIAVAAIGFPLVVVGALLLVLPGPGVVIIVTALVILSSEFKWTRKYLELAKSKLVKANSQTDKYLPKGVIKYKGFIMIVFMLLVISISLYFSYQKAVGRS